jgi:hypothetical protein
MPRSNKAYQSGLGPGALKAFHSIIAAAAGQPGFTLLGYRFVKL